MSQSSPIHLFDHSHPRPFPPPSYNAEPHQTKSSLDITQRLERNLAHLNASNNVYKRWSYEIISWSISAICMAAIVGILAYCSNKALVLSSLHLTSISVLSKLTSAALILPTSEALGQLKWSWFNGKKSKEIWDFEIFDKASRGPWGSIMLLLRTKGRSLAALGAVLTVLLLANDTFFQQVVDLPERWVLQGKGSIAKVVRYDPDSLVELRDQVRYLQQEQYVRPLLQQFFYNNGTQPVAMGSSTRPEVPVACPTSNCTFPDFHTLGTFSRTKNNRTYHIASRRVCSRCTDISDILEYDCKSRPLDWIGNLTLYESKEGQPLYPNGTVCGYFVNSTSDSATLMSGYTTTAMNSSQGSAPAGEALLLRMMPLTTTFTRNLLWGGALKFKDLRNPILDALIVAAEDGYSGVRRGEPPIAKECALTWCIKRIRSSYHYATLEEEVVSVVSNSTPGQNPWWFDMSGSDDSYAMVGYFEDVNIDLPAENQTYGTSNETHNRILNNFDDIFPSFMTAVSDTEKPNWRVKAWLYNHQYHRPVKQNPWIPPQNITIYMERMATALTNALRSSSSSDMVEGPAYAIETYVHVKWAWLTFPFLILLLSLIFLVATIRKTATGLGIWKTSTMPTLLYGLPKDMQKDFTPSFTQTSAKSSLEEPKHVRIRLHPEKGWRVSGQPVSPRSPAVIFRSNQPPPGWI
ncbi:unnamed protein product [Periconia digitata]|uniref:DUF3176 domain containing protein n=1 Tax=Periconia digitata TaxID=1303443 RepID=A0A9W4UAF5_9PLEO|nr:unnamed protein product [Periconia digitata]